MNDCRFCTMPGTPHGSVYWAFDKYAVTDGHILIIPRRHIASWFEATVEEVASLLTALVELRADGQDADPAITGFNVGINDGVSAGQTVMHAHAHLIPRRDGDMDDPAGGVRGVIPSKQKYESGE